MHALARYDPDIIRARPSVEPRSIARSTSIARVPPTSAEGSSDFSRGEPRWCSRVPASSVRRWRSSAASRLSSATEGSDTACCSSASERSLVRPTRRQDDTARLGAGNPARRRASTRRPTRIVRRPSPAVRRLLPIVEWLPRYERRWLRGDLAAGIAVTALIVPKNLGYAGIAGVPLQNGLYAAAAGALIYAVFCTSRQISTGPSSSLAAVAGGAVLVTGLARRRGSPARGSDHPSDRAALPAAGRVKARLDRTVPLEGGRHRVSRRSAVDVVIGELPKLTGTSSDGVNAWRELGSWIRGLDELDWTTLAVGLTALVVIVGSRSGISHPRRSRPRRRRSARLGPARPRRPRRRARRRRTARAADPADPRPRRGPGASGSDRHRRRRAAADRLLPEHRDARAFAARHRYRIDLDQESVAQGMANVGAGVLRGCRCRPVSPPARSTSRPEHARRSRRWSPGRSYWGR